MRWPMQRAPQADAAHSVGHRSVLRRVGKGAVVGKLVKWLLPATKLPRKSILGYLAMYPRINGQVSKDTLASKLASFFHAASLGLFQILLDAFSLHNLKP